MCTRFMQLFYYNANTIFSYKIIFVLIPSSFVINVLN